jgi:hypothetical protein
MRAAVFLLVFATTAFAQWPEEEPTPPIDPKIDFRVSVVGKRNEFHIGEIIPIELSFSSRLRRHFQVNQASYDRSGRMDYERFTVTPAEGAVDPLAEYFAAGPHIGGGYTPVEFLKEKPWTIQLQLNEWVRFTKAGEYKLRVETSRIDMVDSSKPHGKARVRAESNEVTLKILPRDSEWEKRTYDQAVATLNDPSSDKKDKSGYSPASRALEILRFLGTPDATRELANQLRDEDPRRGTFDCYIGLITSPERELARQALEEALADPGRPIVDTLLDALVWLETNGKENDAGSAAGKMRVLEKAVDALTHKSGEPLRLSLYPVFARILPRRDEQLLASDIVEKLVNQLLDAWDELPARQQTDLLESAWDRIKRPAVRPILERSARSEQTDLAGIAIRRWFDLDPGSARAVIIAEISRPKPRFGVRRLGILPDKMLPEVEQPLIEHLRGEGDSESGANIASLIARYAGVAILPRVLEILDAKIGRCGCEIQAALLAYVLRVNPEAARPRIEKASVARRENDSGCYRDLLRDIAAIHYDPLLESIGLRVLDDPDEEVAGKAASLLADHGSAAAEFALWRRYEKWCKRWVGRELQVNLQAVAAQRLNESGRDEVSVGRSFARAIAEGDGWLTDEAKLQRLKTMSKVPTIQSDIDRSLEQWHRSPLALAIISCGPKSSAQSDVADFDRFWAKVAHYTFYAFDELKAKLSQFPRGTKFELSPPWDKMDQACIDDLRAFLASHEFSVTDAKKDDGS